MAGRGRNLSAPRPKRVKCRPSRESRPFSSGRAVCCRYFPFVYSIENSHKREPKSRRIKPLNNKPTSFCRSHESKTIIGRLQMDRRLQNDSKIIKKSEVTDQRVESDYVITIARQRLRSVRFIDRQKRTSSIRITFQTVQPNRKVD